jgi:hypothetical protein
MTRARILAALRRFEASLAGEILGAVCLFAGLWLALWLPLILGVAP